MLPDTSFPAALNMTLEVVGTTIKPMALPHRGIPGAFGRGQVLPAPAGQLQLPELPCAAGPKLATSGAVEPEGINGLMAGGSRNRCGLLIRDALL